MNARPHTGLMIRLACWGLCLSSLFCSVSFASTGFTVLVNEQNPAESLSMNELRDIFHGERSFWEKNHKIAVFMGPKGSPERVYCLEEIVRHSESKYKRHWIGKIFRGEAVAAPKEVQAGSALFDYLKHVPGAIAIIPSDQVDLSTPNPGFKILKIDNKGPNDPGYRLLN